MGDVLNINSWVLVGGLRLSSANDRRIVSLNPTVSKRPHIQESVWPDTEP